MAAEMQSPGCAPRASRDCCGGRSHSFNTALDGPAQMFARRFCVSPWLAQDLAWLCFGEGGGHD